MRFIIALVGAILMLQPAAAHGDAEHLYITAHNEDGEYYFMATGFSGKNPVLNVQKGATYEITFTNQGSVAHDFNFGDLASTKLIAPGASTVLTVEVTEDVTAYWCNPHRGQGMAGEMVVEEDKDSPGLGLGLLVGALVAVAVLRAGRHR